MRSLLRAVMVAVRRWPAVAGRAPSWPAETSVFWLVSALLTSEGISEYFCSFAGSSQMRMA